MPRGRQSRPLMTGLREPQARPMHLVGLSYWQSSNFLFIIHFLAVGVWVVKKWERKGKRTGDFHFFAYRLWGPGLDRLFSFSFRHHLPGCAEAGRRRHHRGGQPRAIVYDFRGQTALATRRRRGDGEADQPDQTLGWTQDVGWMIPLSLNLNNVQYPHQKDSGRHLVTERVTACTWRCTSGDPR